MNNTYDLKNRRFDYYSCFYSEADGFVSFETGEVMYKRNDCHVDNRKFYPQYNVSILYTNFIPSSIKFIHPHTGKLVPQAQLMFGGGQHLIIDHQYKTATKLMNWRTGFDKLDSYPEKFERCGALALNDKAKIVGAQIDIKAPTVITPEMEAWAKTVQVIAKLKAAEKKDNTYSYVSYPPEATSTVAMTETPYEYVRKLDAATFSAIRGIAEHGIKFTRDPLPVDYLVVEIK